jgi:hypothetical protein
LDRFDNRERPIPLFGLRGESDLARVFALLELANITFSQIYRPAGRFKEPSEGPQEGCFAAAIRTKQHQQLASPSRQRKPLENRMSAVTASHITGQEFTHRAPAFTKFDQVVEQAARLLTAPHRIRQTPTERKTGA